MLKNLSYDTEFSFDIKLGFTKSKELQYIFKDS